MLADVPARTGGIAFASITGGTASCQEDNAYAHD
jgi:hypothetical protein